MPLSAGRVLKQFKHAMYFDGVDDYVAVPMSLSLRFTTELTLEAGFILPQSIGGLYYRSWVFIGAPYDYYYRYNQFSDPNSWGFLIYDTTTNNERALGSFRLNPASGYHYTAVTWKSGVGGFFFFDGTKPSVMYASSYTIRQTASQFIIRWAYYPAMFTFARAYSRALSDSEILWNYQHPDDPVRNGLVLWLEADPQYVKDIDGDGILEWLDLSGNGNHGKVYGARLVDLWNAVYAVTAVKDNVYSVTAINHASSPASWKWDRIEVYDYGVSGSRVNVGDAVTVWVKLRYGYDGVVFDSSKGSVQIGGISASWDSVDNRWYVTVSQQNVGKVDFQCPSAFTDNQYGLTAIVGQVTQSVVWDKVVFTLSVQKPRIDVGATAQISVDGRYAYDSAPFRGTYVLNDTTTKSAVGRWAFRVSNMSDELYGLTAFETNEVEVVWDTLKIADVQVDLLNQKVRVKAVYAYDSAPIVNGLVNYLGLLVQTDAQGYAEFDLSKLSEVPFNSECYVESDRAYGLTASTRGIVAFCKVPVGPFSVRGDHAVGNASWNDVERMLKFTTKGTCIVYVGDYGQPLRVEVNGQIYTDWSYDYSRREVTIRNLASEVVLVWASSAPVGGGGGGGGGAVGVLPPSPAMPATMPATPAPATAAPVAPAPAVDLVNVGIGVIVAAIVGGYAYSQLKRSPRRRYREAWRKRLEESRATVRIARAKAGKVRWTKRSRFD